LRVGRFFPEQPVTVAINRLSRGLDLRDAVAAHELALADGAPGFGIYNISARSPFQEDDVVDLLTDAPGVIRWRLPWLEEAFAGRGWRLPERIDRVYVTARAERELGFRRSTMSPRSSRERRLLARHAVDGRVQRRGEAGAVAGEKAAGPWPGRPSARRWALRSRAARASPIRFGLNSPPRKSRQRTPVPDDAGGEGDVGGEDEVAQGGVLGDPIVGGVGEPGTRTRSRPGCGGRRSGGVGDDRDRHRVAGGDLVDLLLDRAGIGVEQDPHPSSTDHASRAAPSEARPLPALDVVRER
jgi:hypothetical protein